MHFLSILTLASCTSAAVAGGRRPLWVARGPVKAGHYQELVEKAAALEARDAFSAEAPFKVEDEGLVARDPKSQYCPGDYAICNKTPKKTGSRPPSTGQKRDVEDEEDEQEQVVEEEGLVARDRRWCWVATNTFIPCSQVKKYKATGDLGPQSLVYKRDVEDEVEEEDGLVAREAKSQYCPGDQAKCNTAPKKTGSRPTLSTNQQKRDVEDEDVDVEEDEGLVAREAKSQYCPGDQAKCNGQKKATGTRPTLSTNQQKREAEDEGLVARDPKSQYCPGDQAKCNNKKKATGTRKTTSTNQQKRDVEEGDDSEDLAPEVQLDDEEEEEAEETLVARKIPQGVYHFWPTSKSSS